MSSLTVGFKFIGVFSGLQYLNTNHTLYDVVKKAELDDHLLSKEAHRAANHLRSDFEKGGIHLCAGIYFIPTIFWFCQQTINNFQKVNSLLSLQIN